MLLFVTHLCYPCPNLFNPHTACSVIPPLCTPNTFLLSPSIFLPYVVPRYARGISPLLVFTFVPFWHCSTHRSARCPCSIAHIRCLVVLFCFISTSYLFYLTKPLPFTPFFSVCLFFLYLHRFYHSTCYSPPLDRLKPEYSFVVGDPLYLTVHVGGLLHLTGLLGPPP